MTTVGSRWLRKSVAQLDLDLLDSRGVPTGIWHLISSLNTAGPVTLENPLTHPNIRIEAANEIVTVTIDRPHRKNACTSSMWAALREGFRQLAGSSARVVVITGAEGDFCAGADVIGTDDAGQGNDKDNDIGKDDPGESHRPRPRVDNMRDIADTVMAIHDCPKPVIAKVDGVCVGAGFGVALAADMIWSSASARYSLIFSRRGLSLDFGTSWLLPKRVGLHQAKRLAFTGEIISAQRAAELGIVNEVVPVDELDEAVQSIAEQVASGPPIALATSKRYLNSASTSSLFSALEAEALGQGVNFATRDTREAMRAFAEKRAPVFEGH